MSDQDMQVKPDRDDHPTSVPFSSNYRVTDDAERNLMNFMKRYFVGPMEPRLFLDQFLPHPSSPTAPAFALNLTPLQNAKKETDMYDLFVESLGSIAPDLEFVNTSTTSDDECAPIEGAHGLAPDVSVYCRKSRRPRTKVTDFSAMEINIEFKFDVNLDAFNDLWRCESRDEGDFERQTEDARDTRGQIIAYASAQMETQLRVFCFTVLICANRARLMRWDRAGVIVTESFDYVLEPEPLVEFFWRYNYMSPFDRGVDTSLRFCVDASLAQITRDRLELPDGAPVYEFCIPDDKLGLSGDFDQQDEYYRSIGTAAPLYLAGLPPYRGFTPVTRLGQSFRIFEHTTDRVLWLKNSWRADRDTFEKEGHVYDVLQQSNVPYLPVFVQAGDVMHRRTLTMDYILSLSGNEEAWPHLRARRYYRLLLGTVGQNLSKFESSHQLVTAVWDAIEAHQKAFDAGYLHCDISPGNILIGPDGRGLLIDWEYATAKDLLIAMGDAGERRGTRQTMSVAVFNRLSEIHQLEDDLESFLHVLMWVSLRYTPSNLTPDVLARWMMEIFDRVRPVGDGELHRGPPARHTWFVCHGYVAPMGRVEFTGRPVLDKLYNALLDQFALRYERDLDYWQGANTESGLARPGTAWLLPCDKGLRPCPALLRTSDWMLELGRKCLGRREEWPLDDRAELQPMPPIIRRRVKRESE